MRPKHLQIAPNKWQSNYKKYNDFVNTFYKCFSEQDIKRVESSQTFNNFMISLFKGPASFSLAILTPLYILSILQISFSEIGIAYQILLIVSSYVFFRIFFSQLMLLKQFKFQKSLYYKYKEEIEELRQIDPVQKEAVAKERQQE